MKRFLVAVSLVLAVHCAYSQAEIPEKKHIPGKWHKNYLHVGLNLPQGDLGSLPFLNLGVKENMLAGRYGEKTGFIFEKGSRFYFNGGQHIVRAGLDWTQFQFTYNQMNWDDYTTRSGGSVSNTNVYGISMKIGPVVSFRPVGKLIVDLRVQVAPALQLSAFRYSGPADTTKFSLLNKRILHSFGWKVSTGIGVHYSFIGLALDYTGGKINSQYSVSTDADGNEIAMQQKIKASFLQATASLNF